MNIEIALYFAAIVIGFPLGQLLTYWLFLLGENVYGRLYYYRHKERIDRERAAFQVNFRKNLKARQRLGANWAVK